jgi:hypothetical protein
VTVTALRLSLFRGAHPLTERLTVAFAGAGFSSETWDPVGVSEPESHVCGGARRPPAGSRNDNRAHVDSAFEDRDVAQCALSTGLSQVVAPSSSIQGARVTASILSVAGNKLEHTEADLSG